MRNKLNNELAVCGFAAVKKLEKKDSSRIKRLYFNQENAPLFGGLCKKIAERKGIYNLVKNSEELEKLSGTVHHQGVVAMISMPEIIPLDSDITDLWIKNKEMHGVNFGVRPEVEEMILALVYREKGKLTSKFSKYYGLDEKANPYNFELADLRKVCQYASTFSAVTFEDFDTMVTTSINRSRNHTPESYSPIEDTIKM